MKKKTAAAPRATHIRCVRRITADAPTTFCGREIPAGEAYFFGPDHAVQSGLDGVEVDGHRLETCAACRNVITRALAGKPETKATKAAAA